MTLLNATLRHLPTKKGTFIKFLLRRLLYQAKSKYHSVRLHALGHLHWSRGNYVLRMTIDKCQQKRNNHQVLLRWLLKA